MKGVGRADRVVAKPKRVAKPKVVAKPKKVVAPRVANSKVAKPKPRAGPVMEPNHIYSRAHSKKKAEAMRQGQCLENALAAARQAGQDALAAWRRS